MKSGIDLIPDVELPIKPYDKVLLTQNKYKAGHLILSNGSFGVCVPKGSSAVVYFPELDGEPVDISTLGEDFVDLGFAITVHKAQGSGFEHVFLVLPWKLSLLSRELLYTALSRAKISLDLFLQNPPEGTKQTTSLLERARRRSYVETRKTSVFGLDPWSYSLEPETGVFVDSKVEYIIYKALMKVRDECGDIDFWHTKKPEREGCILNIRTDFSVRCHSTGVTWYWEHLGFVGNSYLPKWDGKLKAYREFGILDQLITTEERHGIGESKIAEIIGHMRAGIVGNEDPRFRFSKHHYRLA
jgi:hypothetical protein